MWTLIPHDFSVLFWLSGLLVAEWLAGYAAQRMNPQLGLRPAAWCLMIAATVAVHVMTLEGPAGFRMLALIAALFLGMKTIVGVGARALGQPALPFSRWMIFATLWPGMNPKRFSGPRVVGLSDWKNLAQNGSLCAVLGSVVMALTGPFYRQTHCGFLATVLFFIGSSLLVHYGFFALTTAFWRSRGFNCGRLFLNPFVSENLGDFWGKRWNLAFHEMTTLAVYGPLDKVFPRSLGLLASFGFSGLLHEFAISLPVQTGYGGPLGYFLLQGVLVIVERGLAKGGWPLRGWPGRLWTFFWILLPLPILFHQAFLDGVVWPLIGISP
jgi:hypothetical protein